ncbi:transglutaminase domain-containing protein [Candidatus Uhrbacteria bacterium]|nr:transglutaminase domain-containing protein [Candidatus Uhrbacteria bacterium]
MEPHGEGHPSIEQTPHGEAQLHLTAGELFREALETNTYEVASRALAELDALQAFRAALRNKPFASFFELFENMSVIAKTPLSPEQKEQKRNAALTAARENSSRFSPLVADLYHALISELEGVAYEPVFDKTQTKIANLKQSGDLDVLCSGAESWELKLNRIETRLLGYLNGMREIDKQESQEMDDDTRQWREQELQKAPTRPPERRNESKPGVDSMERLKEGERAPAIWSIYPAVNGRFREQAFSRWDSVNNTWVEDEYAYEPAQTVPLSGNTDPEKGPIDFTMNAEVIPGKWVSVPMLPTHDVHAIEAGGRSCHLLKDKHGDLVVSVEGESHEPITIQVMAAPSPDKTFRAKNSDAVSAQDMPAEFSEETNTKISGIAQQKRGNVARARALKTYAVQRISYLAPKNRAEADYYNTLYRTSPKGFPGAVDEVRKGDCDTVATYWSGLCAKIYVPTRHVVGHAVNGADEHGFAHINIGTGHGWGDVWDEKNKKWVEMDPTPPGDPNLEQTQLRGGAPIPYYGEQEAIRPSDAQLEELWEKLAKHTERLSYTPAEHSFAQAAGIELALARRIVREVNEAENTRLPNGELVVNVLADVYDAVIESRKTSVPAYEGPVRRFEGGGRITHFIQHVIGTQAGDQDPASRERQTEEIREERVLGGLDFFIIGDKSGSMNRTVEGEKLWHMQRRAEYLIFSSLHRVARKLDHARLPEEYAFSVRTLGLSFRGHGEDDLDEDKPLSPVFTPEDKVKLWHSLTTQGVGNGDPEALAYVRDQIKKEIEENNRRGVYDNRLRIIIACSDGGYVGDDSLKMQALAQELGEMGVVVVGMGLTETAAQVPLVMHNPPHSYGALIRDINDLPLIVAKFVISEAIKLFPQKTRKDAQLFLDACIAKFPKAA